jgi:cation transporter-like permease
LLTKVYFLQHVLILFQCEEAGVSNARSGTELDISRVSESIARAFCVALVPLLDLLATSGVLILAVRANLDPDNVSNNRFCLFLNHN